jgi:hypothetical protein
MNELPSCLGLGGRLVERGSESGVLNFILVLEEGVTYSQDSAVIILCFSRYSIVLFCIITNLGQCFCDNMPLLRFLYFFVYIYFFIYKWKHVSFI